MNWPSRGTSSGSGRRRPSWASGGRWASGEPRTLPRCRRSWSRCLCTSGRLWRPRRSPSTQTTRRSPGADDVCTHPSVCHQALANSTFTQRHDALVSSQSRTASERKVISEKSRESPSSPEALSGHRRRHRRRCRGQPHWLLQTDSARHRLFHRDRRSLIGRPRSVRLDIPRSQLVKRLVGCTDKQAHDLEVAAAVVAAAVVAAAPVAAVVACGVVAAAPVAAAAGQGVVLSGFVAPLPCVR